MVTLRISKETMLQKLTAGADDIFRQVLRAGRSLGPLSLTISIGIAQTKPGAGQSDSIENLFLRADQGLYAAKQAGCNCTLIFDPDKTGTS